MNYFVRVGVSSKNGRVFLSGCTVASHRDNKCREVVAEGDEPDITLLSNQLYTGRWWWWQAVGSTPASVRVTRTIPPRFEPSGTG
jgi:hypothetical protein